nr:N-6 DNA methylase [Candidatus Sigynarchaeota archaeon]
MTFNDVIANILEIARDHSTVAKILVDGHEATMICPSHAITARVPKAFCIVADIAAERREIFIVAAYKVQQYNIEVIFFADQAHVVLFDIADPKSREIEASKMQVEFLPCIEKYIRTGHKIFLDSLFHDGEFKKRCWVAFQDSMQALENHGITQHDTRTRIVLQILILLRLQALRCIGQEIQDITRGFREILEKIHSDKGGTSLSADMWPAVIIGKEIGAPIAPKLAESNLESIIVPWLAIPGIHELLDEGIVCFLMERSLPENYKKKSGSYYTPKAWAWFVCHYSIQAWLEQDAGHSQNDVTKIAILDPAMGSGDFLDAMADVLIDTCSNQDGAPPLDDPSDRNLRRQMILVDTVYKHNLHGIDMNDLAVHITRVRFFLKVLKHCVYSGNVHDMANRFSINLTKADFLTTRMPDAKYDIVIGNPPYLMEVRSNQDIFRYYSKQAETSKHYEPKMDLFYFFMFKDVEILNDHGVLAIVVQEYWLDRFHAKNLRTFIFQSMNVLEIVLFKRHKVFQSAPGHHSMLFFATKHDGKENTASSRAMIVQGENIPEITLLSELISRSGPHLVIHDMESRDIYDSKKDKVYVEGNDEKTFFEKIYAIPHFFIAEPEIQVGINIPQPFIRRAGKIEGVFVITVNQAEQMGLSREEQALLKPFHKAVDLDAYSFIAREELFIIYTTNDAMKIVEANPSLYPRLRAHLDHYASFITSDHKPYGLHRPRQVDWFESRAKIIGVRKTKTPKFTMVPQDYYMDQAVTFLCLDHRDFASSQYICAFLNSRIANKLFSSIKTQGGQLQIDKNVLTRIPIPKVSREMHDTITCLSSWLTVLVVLRDNGRGSRIDGAQLESIELVIDSLFEMIVNGTDLNASITKSLNEESPKMDLPCVHIEDYLKTSICASGLPGVKSTKLDLEQLEAATFASIYALIDFLSRVKGAVLGGH